MRTILSKFPSSERIRGFIFELIFSLFAGGYIAYLYWRGAIVWAHLRVDDWPFWLLISFFGVMLFVTSVSLYLFHRRSK